MSRPQRVGLQGLAVAVGILLAWTGHASATFTFGGPFTIAIYEPTEGSGLPIVVFPTPSSSNVGKGATPEFVIVTYNNYITAGITTTSNLPIVTVGLLEGSDNLSDTIKVSVAPVLNKTTGLPTGAGNLVISFISESDSGSTTFDCALTGSTQCTQFIYEPASGPNNLTQAGNSALLTAGYQNLALTVYSEGVPEPGTLFLLGSGLVGVGTLWRRRRHR